MDITTIADEVVKFFTSRGGFDHWWDQVEDEDKEEIIHELGDLLEGLIG